MYHRRGWQAGPRRLRGSRARLVRPRRQPRALGEVAPVDLTDQMSAPLLGIFGNDDTRPKPAEVDRTEEALRKHNKTYEFHRYDGAGHGFFNWSAAAYRQEQARDGWERV